jgi:hypothetical protein
MSQANRDWIRPQAKRVIGRKGQLASGVLTSLNLIAQSKVASEVKWEIEVATARMKSPRRSDFDALIDCERSGDINVRDIAIEELRFFPDRGALQSAINSRLLDGLDPVARADVLAGMAITSP